MNLAHWERSTFDADGLTGERLNFRSDGRTVATVVVWPGRATRVFWLGGITEDFTGRDSRSQAIAKVEEAEEHYRQQQAEIAAETNIPQHLVW
jgi:hypothetical protein